MNAPVIKFTPAPAPVEPVVTPINQGYTKIDNATDLMVLADLPNALVKPYLFLLSRRGLRVKTVHWGEIAAFCKRGQVQTFSALKELTARGLVTSEGGMYRAISGFSSETHRKVVQKPEMSDQKNAVLHGIQKAPELRNEGTKKEEEEGMPEKTPNTPTSGQGIQGKAEGQTPSGVTADAARQASPSQHVLNTAEGERGDEDVTGSEKGSAAPQTLNAMLRVISAAGLHDAWIKWVRLNALRPVTQEAQAPVWLGWIDEGFAREVAHEVEHIVTSGSYGSPWPALKKRMGAYQLKNPTAAPEGPAEGGRAKFRPGMRVRYPDGSEALVVSVQASGISTNHPQYRDVPLGMLKSLEVVE